MDSSPPREGSGDTVVATNFSAVDDLEPELQLAFLRDRLSPMSRVPTLARKLTDLGPVISDPKSAYVLGFIDGILPLETIVEVVGLPELDTLRVLDRAIEQHAITFDKSAR
jgi:hypothetical protein